MRNAFYPFASTLVGLTAAAQVASAQPRGAAPPPLPPPTPVIALPAPVPPPAPPPPAEPPGPPLSLVDAVATALKLHPSIRAARAELAARRADVGAARGPFDPLFNAGLQHVHDATPLGLAGRIAPNQNATLTDTTSLNVGAAAGTTWGMSIAPTVSFQRVHQRADVSLAGTGLPPQDPFQQASVGLAVVQHLLRGAGWVGAASAIDRTSGAARAAEHTVNFAAQQQAFATTAAYFQYVASGEQVGLLRNAETGAQRLVEETRVLVVSDQRPRADLHQLEGNLANRSRSVLEAETDRSQSLFALRTAMGLGAEGATPWAVTNPLPPPAPVGDENELVRVARERREDLSAAHELLGATNADLRGAEWNTNLNLDVNASAGFTGLLTKDGVGPFFAAAGSNVPGVSAAVGVSMELPFNNTARLADRDSKRAFVDQARIAEADIKRRVPIDTLSAVAELRLAEAALQASTQAVDSLALALVDEQDRMHSGVGTVIDMILTEDRLISARLARTSNHLRYALARSRLVFATGGMPSDPARAPAALQALSTP
jgi:outer membrane protein TolC